MKYNLSHINSLLALRKEQQLVMQRIKEEETELRLKMYEIPGELAAAGANTFIPKILRGKITNAALNGGKKIINGFFAPEGQQNQNLLTYAAKKPAGVLSLLKKGFSLFKAMKK
ncbi:MAG: hypothetical protein M3040_00035 [Bacteroidota bacterium]|nr:hypothetical protein [Bacteroidota bacterium]